MVRIRKGNAGKALVRSRDGRMLAGVCPGAAGYPGAEVTLVRMIRAAVSLVSGDAGVLACLAVWALIPDESQNRSIAENLTGKNKDSWTG